MHKNKSFITKYTRIFADIPKKEFISFFIFDKIYLGDDIMDCLFCKIIAGDIPSYKVYEDDLALAFLDINPTSSGHTLIIPKKHFKDMDDIDIDTLNHIFKVAKKLKKVLEEKLKCDGISLCQNNGCVQDVKHFHLHLIPKYKNQSKLSLEEVYKLIK